jgi:adenylate kinase family enzyme
MRAKIAGRLPAVSGAGERLMDGHLDGIMADMKRIAIIGCGGAGKSTLSVALSATLGIECHHLDRMFLSAGGQPHRKLKGAARGQFLSEHATVLKQPSWIIDGNFNCAMDARFERADTIIFLDLPTTTCLRGVITRDFQRRGLPGVDIIGGNSARLSWVFLRYILRYRRRRRPALLERLEAARSAKEIVVLKSRSDVRTFLQSTADKRLVCIRDTDASSIQEYAHAA